MQLYDVEIVNSPSEKQLELMYELVMQRTTGYATVPYVKLELRNSRTRQKQI